MKKKQAHKSKLYSIKDTNLKENELRPFAISHSRKILCAYKKLKKNNGKFENENEMIDFKKMIFL